jgi:hypothetical protein
VVQEELEALARSTNAGGDSQSVFNPSEIVHVEGEGFPESTPVSIYLIPDGDDALPANAVASATATTDGAGDLPVTPVWDPMLTPGEYDIWVDVNQNDVFDAGDVWNNQAFGIYGFLVIPEFLLGTIMSIAGMLAAFVTHRFSKRRHP